MGPLGSAKPGLNMYGRSPGYPKMAWRREDADHYRDRAEELRMKADMFSLDNRKMLLGMADLYDRFADEVEEGRWESVGPH